ncbi:ATP-binding protein [Shewanella xiamenensis]|uniref:ATP-binding protein n=1 Tax=Shewanella xiamenensis TaxID=332186 RepID=UPI0024A764DD|nr:ATP-binding protein [Shewanella xiamenensis]MDI5838358.1 hypothetical protein [Shewanella xiamenensis]MDI5842302.1 hypothetical protein [Shewanella xiamenensis]MDI5846255.1 hypothetical protein [Shewanella xiamenensis]MDI5850211.1 hypothetical protein [Shewanella xiamenensis]MDI5854158.1 hypothetical protein [Shewanella xiamenensis]
MTLAISRLKIIAKTIDGDYGVDIPFEKGLFILRLDNSHGKSTCINAIAYALGMEKNKDGTGITLLSLTAGTKAAEVHPHLGVAAGHLCL